MAEPAFRARFLAPNLFEPMPGSPAAFAALIKADAARWARVIAQAGLTIRE